MVLIFYRLVPDLGEVLVSVILPIVSGRKGGEIKFLVVKAFNSALKLSRLKCVNSFLNYLTAKQVIWAKVSERWHY